MGAPASMRWPRRSRPSSPFGTPSRRQRCIGPVYAFYKEDTGEPAALRDVRADGLALAMTGLWERWKDRGTGNTVQTFTMTTVPNELCRPIHDRMPVILPREKWAIWVGEHAADPDELRWMILRPYPPGLMRAYPVGAASRECAEQRRRAA